MLVCCQAFRLFCVLLYFRAGMHVCACVCLCAYLFVLARSQGAFLYACLCLTLVVLLCLSATSQLLCYCLCVLVCPAAGWLTDWLGCVFSGIFQFVVCFESHSACQTPIVSGSERRRHDRSLWFVWRFSGQHVLGWSGHRAHDSALAESSGRWRNAFEVNCALPRRYSVCASHEEEVRKRGDEPMWPQKFCGNFWLWKQGIVEAAQVRAIRCLIQSDCFAWRHQSPPRLTTEQWEEERVKCWKRKEGRKKRVFCLSELSGKSWGI